MPPTKQRRHFVLAASQDSAQPVMNSLLANGMLIGNIKFLAFTYQLSLYYPEDVAFIFLPDFSDNPRYEALDRLVHQYVTRGAIVKPKPSTAEDLTIKPGSLTLDGMQGVTPTMSWVDETTAYFDSLQERTNRYGAHWEKIFREVNQAMTAITDDHQWLPPRGVSDEAASDGYSKHWNRIFQNVVTDSVGDRQRSSLREAAEKAADALDPPCDCYYCRTFVLTGEEETSEYRLESASNSAESAPEEPVEYLQVFLGGLYHGTKAPQISIVPGTEFFFTDDADFYETYRLTDHSVLGMLTYFWVHVSLWDDRQRVVREYLLEPLEA